MTDTTGKTRADLILAAGMIPLLHGAQEADDDQHDQPGDDPDEQAPDADQQPDDQADDEPDDDGDDDTDVPELKARLAEAEADAARYKRRLLASDLRKKTLERELNDARKRQAPKPSDEQTRDRQPDEQTAHENAELKSQLADLKVRRQFDDVTKYQWQNPAAAYRLLDLTDVRQDDGTVDRDDLADAVDALAKANPYLVKTDTSSTPKATRPTGQQPGAARRQEKPDKARLASRFGALNGRVN